MPAQPEIPPALPAAPARRKSGPFRDKERIMGFRMGIVGMPNVGKSLDPSASP